MQRVILWIWAAAIVAAGIYPPWITRGGSPMGYGLLFNPYRGVPNHIDVARLGVEWVIATVVAGAAFVAGAKKALSNLDKA